LQRKPRIGPTNDPLEHEADRAADAVTSGKRAGPMSGASSAASQRKCETCEFEDDTMLQRKEQGASHASPNAAGIAADAVAQGGTPLTAIERAYFEPRFQHSLSDVRIHRGASADAAARGIGARAYTLGHNIAFAAGEYAPGTQGGAALLAHELAHVVQQRSQNSASASIQRAPERVSLRTEGACADPRAIAEAIPGALAMVRTAFFDWFQATASRDSARVNSLLRANFDSADVDTRSTVHGRLGGIYTSLQDAESGKVTFACTGNKDPDCQGRNGYVLPGEGARIHLCPAFFTLSLEGRRWNLMHECAHLAGAMQLPEPYWSFFGPVSENQCQQTMTGSAREKLNTADHYARLIWCLTRKAGTEVNPP
jgi:hypothetical protein